VAGYSTQFGTDLLNNLGLPVTAENLRFLAAWAQAEGGGATFNPFNTTQPGGTAYNKVGVQNYASYQQGLGATVQTLKNGDYGPILAALKQGNSAMAAAQAVAQTPWGTGTLVEKVLGGSPPESGTSGTMNPSGALNQSTTPAPVIDFNTINSDFASVAGLLSAVPELKQWAQNIINKQIQVDTPAGKAQAEQLLEQTNWWKTTNNAQRAYEQLKVTNPGEAASQLGDARTAIQAQARQMGVELNASDLNTWALRKVGFGWTDQQIQSGLAAYLSKSNPNSLTGAAGADVDSIRAMAANYGISPTRTQLQSWVAHVQAGQQTVDGLKNFFQQQAKLIFPGLSKLIDEGHTVADVANTYTQQEANWLEVDPQSIDWANDPYIKKALQYNPAATGQGVQASAAPKATAGPQDGIGTMPMYQFEQMVKSDPRWLNTDNAKQGALATLDGLGKAFGFSS